MEARKIALSYYGKAAQSLNKSGAGSSLLSQGQ
jgi:hypothetical protein